MGNYEEIATRLDKRLNEVNILLLQAADNYFKPEGFITNIKAAIQAHRNVTFALQNEKKAFPIDFDGWYQPWQEKMKNDKMMKWLNDTRTNIVHCKDLKTKSIAKVRLYGYEDIFVKTMELPIELEIEETIDYLIEKKVISPMAVLFRAMVDIERVWIADDFNSFDILNILERGFVFLCALIQDAYKVLGVNNYSTDEMLAKYMNKETQLLCLNGIKKTRKISFSTEDFTIRKFEEKNIDISHIDRKKVKNHYKVNDDFFNGIKSGIGNVNDLFFRMIEGGKIILSKDGNHIPTFITLKGRDILEMRHFSMEDKSGKFMMMEQLAQSVKRSGGDGVILICEMWVGSMESLETLLEEGSIKDTKEKREALGFYLIQKANSSKNVIQYFKKGMFGKIHLEESIESTNVKINSFEAFYKVLEWT